MRRRSRCGRAPIRSSRGHQTSPFPQSTPESARVVRRGHPFDGWELTVVRSWRTADGQLRPAVDTEVGTGHLPSLWAIRFVTPNPSLCDLNIGLAMDWERVQSLFPAHLALHAGMILFHPDADGPDWPHRQVTVACRHPTPDVENMRPCCVPEGCGSALDGKRRGTPARAQALLRRAEVAVCREDPARYPERSF